MNRSGEDPGKLGEVRPHRGLDPQRVVVPHEPDTDASIRRPRFPDSRCGVHRGENSVLDGDVSARLLEVEARAPDADIPVGENRLDRHPLEDPQIPRSRSSGGEGEGGQRAALEDREDRRDGGVVPGEGKKLPAQRRHVEAAAAGSQVDPRGRAVGGEFDFLKKPGRLRGKPRERDRCLPVLGVQRARDPQAADLQDPPIGPPKGEGRSGDLPGHVERAGVRRRDRDAHIEVAQDGELHPVAGSRQPPFVDLDDQTGGLRGERRDERREALQRIRTRCRLLPFPGRLGSLEGQVRSVHPDCGDAEPAAKQ